MNGNVKQLIKLINDRKVVKTEAVITSAGEQTKVYLDIPGVLSDTKALAIGEGALAYHLIANGLLANATMIAGPMTGSIPLVISVAAHDYGSYAPDGLKWSIIRDHVKDHGLGRGFVGAEPGPGDKVILVDDVASSGTSLVEAYEKVIETGAEVVAIVPLVDRSDKTAKLITAHGSVFHKLYPDLKTTPYLPVLTYKDLGLEAL